MNEQEATLLADLTNGEICHTGGGIYVVICKKSYSTIAVLSMAGVHVYKSLDDFHAGESPIKFYPSWK